VRDAGGLAALSLVSAIIGGLVVRVLGDRHARRHAARVAANLVRADLRSNWASIERVLDGTLQVRDLDFGWLDVDAWFQYRADLVGRLPDELWEALSAVYEEMAVVRRHRIHPGADLATRAAELETQLARHRVTRGGRTVRLPRRRRRRT
jgi:hypothetical protein